MEQIVSTEKINSLNGRLLQKVSSDGIAHYGFFYKNAQGNNKLSAELWVNKYGVVQKSSGFELNSKGEVILYKVINPKDKSRYQSKSIDFKED
jgi:hypothetical protein